MNREKLSLEPFARNLAALGMTAEAELLALMRLVGGLERHVDGTVLVEAGGEISDVVVLIEGVAARQCWVGRGKRQITGFVLPGDFCDFRFVSGSAGQEVIPLGDTVVARLPVEAFESVAALHPSIREAVETARAIEEGLTREWVASLGQRDALQRTAHLMCELDMRLRRIGRVHHDRFAFPPTQSDLADALGMTTVHVSRTMQELKRSGLMENTRSGVLIKDRKALQHLAMFGLHHLYQPADD